MDIRLIEEYNSLRKRTFDLDLFIASTDNGSKKVELPCPLDLLKYQSELMNKYLMVLEVRLNLLGFKLE